jgi:hypothetical protein
MVQAGEMFVLLVRAWGLDKDIGFLVTICSRSMVCSPLGKTMHNVAVIQRPLGILARRFRQRRCEHKVKDKESGPVTVMQLLVAYRFTNRSSSSTLEFHILCRFSKISSAQMIRCYAVSEEADRERLIVGR